MGNGTDIKFGIVGVGVIAAFHARALEEISGASLAACQDINHERAKAFSADYACEAVETLEDLLRGDRVDAVIICTPSGLHLEPALAAAAAGKHLVIEKPLEITPERCDRIIDAASRAGVLVTGIFPARYSDGAQTLKAAVEAGRFGRISVADAAVKWYRSREYYAQAGWRGTWTLDGGGALMNQSIHAVDLLQWITGGIAEVSAYTATVAHDGLEVEDTACAALLHRSGALGTITGTTASWPGWAKRTEISGFRGSAVLEDEKLTRWEFEEPEPGDEEIRRAFSNDEGGAAGAGDPTSIGHEGHRRQLADFIRALAGNGAPLIDGAEARKAVAVIDAIYRSARSGKRETP